MSQLADKKFEVLKMYLQKRQTVYFVLHMLVVKHLITVLFLSWNPVSATPHPYLHSYYYLINIIMLLLFFKYRFCY